MVMPQKQLLRVGGVFLEGAGIGRRRFKELFSSPAGERKLMIENDHGLLTADNWKPMSKVMDGL